MQKPTFILIDEPEQNLHPSLQAEFLTTLGTYASKGVIFTTHSLGLARSVADRLYSVSRGDDESFLRPWETTPQLPEFLGEMSYSAYRELGHELVLCVEGPNDIKPVRQLLRRLGKEHTTVVVPLGGDAIRHDAIVETVAELSRLSTRTAVLLDSEKVGPESEPEAHRLEFQRECEKLHIRVHLTELRSLENYFPERAIKAALGALFHALKPFERVGDADPPWPKGKNWLIAREMSLAEVEGSDVGRFLSAL
jgi:ABC-type sulfate/molybdate transport systems ATPase subunit